MVKRALQRLFYLAAFILLFGLTCSLLSSPRLEKLFYPFHYREEILAAAAEQQIDPLLIAAVIQAESGFREDAVSAEGARGLMQLLPSTARWIAERRGESDFHPDKLFDPRYNIAAGSWYLADLLRQFHGSRRPRRLQRGAGPRAALAGRGDLGRQRGRPGADSLQRNPRFCAARPGQLPPLPPPVRKNGIAAAPCRDNAKRSAIIGSSICFANRVVAFFGGIKQCIG